MLLLTIFLVYLKKTNEEKQKRKIIPSLIDAGACA